MADENAVANTAPKELTEAQQRAAKTRDKKKVIRRRYGEFIPKGGDPVAFYKQWKASIFADPDDADDETMYFVLAQANALGIDPTVPKQIYALPFNTKNKKTQQYEKKYNIVIGIEAMIAIADRTGQYGGTTKPEYEYAIDQDGKAQLDALISCTIGVHKIVQGVLVTSEQTVYFEEYTTGYNLWKSKPKTMLKKVALAHALRATFSALKAVNISEELERGDVIEQDGNGNVIETNTTAALQSKAKACKTLDELQVYNDSLSAADKAKARPYIEARFNEIG